MPSGVYKRTKKHKESISKGLKTIFQNGRVPFMKGKHHTEETKRKMAISISKAKKGKKFSEKHKNSLKISRNKRIDNIGNKCHFWKDGRSQNKEYLSWLKNKRNRLKKSNSGSHTFGEWQTLKAQYNWTCPACKRQEPNVKLTEDHIIPLSKDGSDNIENIQPLCLKCNLIKHTKIIKYEK